MSDQKEKELLEEVTDLAASASASEITEYDTVPEDSAELAPEPADAVSAEELSAGISAPKPPKKSRKKKKAAKKRQQKLEEQRKAQQEAERTAHAPEAQSEEEPAPEPEPEKPSRKGGKKGGTKKPRSVGKIIAAVLASLIVLGLGAAGGYQYYVHTETQKYIAYRKSLPYTIESVDSSGSFDEEGLVTVTVKVTEDEYKDGEPLYCITDRDYLPLDDSVEWLEAKDNVCEFQVGPGHHYFHLKDSNNVYTTDPDEKAKLDMTLAVRLVGSKAYLAVGTYKGGYSCEIATLGHADPKAEWSVADTSVLEAGNGAVKGLQPGDSSLIVTAGGLSDSVDVMVTDLITIPDSNTYKKPLLQGDVYTPEQEAILDEILFARVAEGGEATRGGVVAATRFLTLEFPYRVPYFFENGRMDPYSRGGGHYCDGEGRYYHKGLYLTSAKYAELDPDGIRYGPAHWGTPLLNWEEKYHFKPGQKYPNGLDCSSFVCWCLKNGGFDFGDVGAGEYEDMFELSDLGTRYPITTELLQSDMIAPGDLIYTDGHMALIVGISDEKIYVAEALFNCVRITSFKRKYSSVPHALYTHIALMGEEYANNGNGEGNWTMMWDWYEGVEDIDRNWNEEWR